MQFRKLYESYLAEGPGDTIHFILDENGDRVIVYINRILYETLESPVTEVISWVPRNIKKLPRNAKWFAYTDYEGSVDYTQKALPDFEFEEIASVSKPLVNKPSDDVLVIVNDDFDTGWYVNGEATDFLEHDEDLEIMLTQLYLDEPYYRSLKPENIKVEGGYLDGLHDLEDYENLDDILAR
jgi:hypothetical protein